MGSVKLGVLIKRLLGHRASLRSVAFTPDGKGLVSGSLDRTLKFWDVSGLSDGKGKDGHGGSSAMGHGTPGEGAVVMNAGTMNFKVPYLAPLFST